MKLCKPVLLLSFVLLSFHFSFADESAFFSAEAEQAKITLPMATARCDEGGQYVWVPKGKGNTLDSGHQGGKIEFQFDAPRRMAVELEALVMAPTGAENSFFVQMDDYEVQLWDLPVKDNWQWVRFRQPFVLTRGKHTLKIKQREDGVKIDSIRLTDIFESVTVKPTRELKPPFEMDIPVAPTFPDRVFNVMDFGAVADGKTKNTEPFAKAIEKCHQSGGGKVRVPAGHYLTGPIHLKSNVNLHLEAGAEIFFSDVFEDYLPVVFVRYECMECWNYSPLIYARDCENIAITGKGILWGQGRAWWEHRKKEGRAPVERLYQDVVQGVPVKERIYGSRKDFLRPSFISPINCKNVYIDGIVVTGGPIWSIHPVYSENVIVRNVMVVNRGPNNDGVTPDSCKNVLIENCLFSTGDDALTLKSGLNQDGWRVNKPCENVVIRNCYARHCRATGGVVIGSEMSGGVRNLFAYDCDFDRVMMGIWAKSMRGRGGYVKNIHVQDITIGTVSNTAIRLSMFYPWSTVQPSSDEPSQFSNFHIKNIDIRNANKAIELIGLSDSPVKNVLIENVDIENARTGIVFEDIHDVKFDNVTIKKIQKEPALTIKNAASVKLDGLTLPPDMEKSIVTENIDGDSISVNGRSVMEVTK